MLLLHGKMCLHNVPETETPGIMSKTFLCLNESINILF